MRHLSVGSVCCLDLQEYQSKELMKNHGINVQKFQVADGNLDVSELVKQLGSYHIVKCLSQCCIGLFLRFGL